MELNDILEKLSLPQDLTRRGFLKAASAAAALGLLNDARAKNGVRPYVILETAKGLIIADPNLCVACHRCELACTEFNDGKATPRLARIKITRICDALRARGVPLTDDIFTVEQAKQQLLEWYHRTRGGQGTC